LLEDAMNKARASAEKARAESKRLSYKVPNVVSNLLGEVPVSSESSAENSPPWKSRDIRTSENVIKSIDQVFGYSSCAKYDFVSRNVEDLSGSILALDHRIRSQTLIQSQLNGIHQGMTGNIQVNTRIRPMNATELKAEADPKNPNCATQRTDETRVAIVDKTDKYKSKREFNFDNVWDEKTSSETVFESCENIATSVIYDKNACIIAYGPTGTGKTFTMVGNLDHKPPLLGISLLTIQRLISLLKVEVESKALESFELRMSIIEVYNNKAFDLLPPPVGTETEAGEDDLLNSMPAYDTPQKRGSTNKKRSSSADKGKNKSKRTSSADKSRKSNSSPAKTKKRDQLSSTPECEAPTGPMMDPSEAAWESWIMKDKQAVEVHWDDKNQSVRFSALGKHRVGNIDDVIRVFNAGNKRRAIHATLCNPESSRGHAIVIVHVTRKAKDAPPKFGSVKLVDLAGCERVKKSGVTGDQMKEAVEINKSLSMLQSVMGALDKKESFVPYRNSILTSILRDVLSGDSRVIMIFAASPSATQVKEMILAYTYASKMRNVTLGEKLNPKAVLVDDILKHSAENAKYNLRRQLNVLIVDALRKLFSKYRKEVETIDRTITETTTLMLKEEADSKDHAANASKMKKLVQSLEEKIHGLEIENEKLQRLKTDNDGFQEKSTEIVNPNNNNKNAQLERLVQNLEIENEQLRQKNQEMSTGIVTPNVKSCEQSTVGTQYGFFISD